MTRGSQGKYGVSALTQWGQFMAATNQSPATIKTRMQIVRAAATHAGRDDELHLTRNDVVSFLARPLSAWSKLTYWKALEAWSRYLREFGHDPASNLLLNVPRPRTPEPVARPINDDTIARLLSAPLSPRASAYVRLALFEALRVHEVAKIRGEDFDHGAGWLMVTGKGGVVAPVPIHPEVSRLALTMPDFGFWFPSPTNLARPTTPLAVSRTLSNALSSIGSTATAHQLRDTAATRLQRAGKDMRVTQQMLRHRSIRSTQKYAGVSDESMKTAMGFLDWAA